MKTTLVIAFVTAVVVAACGGGKKGATTPNNKADPSMTDKGSGATNGSAGSGSAMQAAPTGDPCGG